MSGDLVIRAYASDIERPNPRTLTARLVPYNTPTTVSDVTPTGIDTYIEEIAPSMFAAQVRNEHPHTLARITFRDQHSEGSGKLGWAVGLRSDDDALYGAFSLMPSRVADVEAMLEAGINEVSIGFLLLAGGTMVRTDGSRLRQRGHLQHVALEPQGAYPGAEVLAMRAQVEVDEAEAEQRQRRDEEAAELAAWLEAEEARQMDIRARVSR